MPTEMLPLPEFALLRPATVAECVQLLADHPGAKLVSGGTDLLPSMKYGLFSPETVISTAGLAELRAITATADGGLRLGAAATLWDVRNHPNVTEHYPALAAACATIATPTIQAMGTLGGNVMLDTRCTWYNQSTFWRESLGGCLKCEGELCWVAPKGGGCYATHSADTVPVLQLLDATVELVSTAGTRTVALSDFYDEDGRTWHTARPGELLTTITLPPPPQAKLAHRKLRPRGAIDYPLLLTAVRVDVDGADRPVGGRVVVSALGPKPLEVDGAGDALARGDTAAVAELAWKQAFPLSTHTWPSTWRKKMVRVEVKRALAEALGDGCAARIGRAPSSAPGPGWSCAGGGLCSC